MSKKYFSIVLEPLSVQGLVCYSPQCCLSLTQCLITLPSPLPPTGRQGRGLGVLGPESEQQTCERAAGDLVPTSSS